jgi:hypothetical protein
MNRKLNPLTGFGLILWMQYAPRQILIGFF